MPKAHPHQAGVATLDVITGGAGGAHPLLVASDALLQKVAALAELTEDLHRSAGDLFGILDRLENARGGHLDLPGAAFDAGRAAESASQSLRVAEQRASAIHSGILRSIERYDRAEELGSGLLHAIDEQVAWSAGQMVRLLAIPLGLTALSGLAVSYFGFGLTPGDLAKNAQSFLKHHGRILTSPESVAVIREMAADADGFEAGLVGLPPGVTQLLQASGVSGVSSAAAGVVGLGAVFGLLRETPVSVRKTSSFEFGTPPRTLVDRANSFPDAHDDPNGEQVRIDRYSTPGEPDRFDVFVTGTVTFDPTARAQPFDFTSDLTGVANESPGSLRGVEQAMTAAGITSSSPVVMNGYSQGGLIASMVAASGNYNVKGVVTFGAPSGQVHIPSSIPVLTVRNTEDLVPATSGYDINPNAVVVQRTVFAQSPVPSAWAVPAHRLEYYQATAAMVDRSQSPQVRSVLDPLNDFAAGATHVDSTLWVATRVPGGGAAAGAVGAVGAASGPSSASGLGQTGGAG